VDPKTLIDACESRILETNGAINATVTTCFEEARLAVAHTRSGDYTDGTDKNASVNLNGLPILIKDTIGVKGMRFTEGSQIFSDRIAECDEAVVSTLRRNGATVIGKTNTPEFAAGSHTFNEVFGTTLNPYDTRKTAGGSSGGAAAALAVGQCWLSVGSDLGGSLRTPASFCNVVGLRPSLGTVPRSGEASECPSKDALHSVNGPMARDIRDLTILLDAMQGTEGWSQECIPEGDDAPPSSFFDAIFTANGDIQKRVRDEALRVAFSMDLGRRFRVHPEVSAVLLRAVEKIQQQLQEHPWRSLECLGEDDVRELFLNAGATFLALRGVNFANAHGSYSHRCKPEIQWNVELGRFLSQNPHYIANAERCLYRIRDSAAKLFRSFDVLACPCVMLPPFNADFRYIDLIRFHGGDGHSGIDFLHLHNYVEWFGMTACVSLLNAPAVSIPCGFTSQGLPVGMQLIGPPNGDLKLLKTAALLHECLNQGDCTPDRNTLHTAERNKPLEVIRCDHQTASMSTNDCRPSPVGCQVRVWRRKPLSVTHGFPLRST